jgi:hypothetical protein
MDLTVDAYELGTFRFPEPELEGRSGVVMGFAIHHPEGVIVVDTGFGFGHPELDQAYDVRARGILDALAGIDVRPADVTAVKWDGDPEALEGRSTAPDPATYDASIERLRELRPARVHLGLRQYDGSRHLYWRPGYPSRAVLGGELAVPCSLQSAPAGPNPLSRSPFSVAARRCDVEDRVPRSGEPRTVSGPEGSSTKRSSSGAAERPGPSRPSWWARATVDRRRVHGT